MMAQPAATRRITVPVLVLLGVEQDAPVYIDGLDEIEGALSDVKRAKIPGQPAVVRC